MNDSLEPPYSLSCSCGKLRLPVRGVPFMSVACFCASCQAAGDLFAAFGNALRADEQSGSVAVKEPNGGTPYILYRKDRVDCSTAAALLYEHRLTPESPTRRVLSVCCNSPMFLEFQNGHWLSVYVARVPADLRPATELRTMTKDAPPGTHFDDGVPSYRTHSFGFMLRLLWAWVKMGFRAPAVEVRGSQAHAQPKPNLNSPGSADGRHRNCAPDSCA